ncbi:predicted protein [Sclerotinia sclerotiorum 1980 UF-70]|uniref:Uncharacterized protein n=1 Tax=Sclerotinia sclerotiorum (strain ATCC 18683 / 1980 / Ss-1) TaxID=665079 RepID=A7EYN4_SCLS1|nr:predicted protein [Sclerotinia sclerotiorum 1980 UF-70]EDN94576.1 predicted protein [Sclerotinia sclerotiorum 1980 UF-70]
MTMRGLTLFLPPGFHTVRQEKYKEMELRQLKPAIIRYGGELWLR